MIKRVLLTGDTHGDFSRFRNYNKEIQEDENTAVIILGDAGLNYFLDERDSHMKNSLSKKYKFKIYCVRGNHEARPQNVPDMKLVWDEDVFGEVYMQEKWPNIRYFKDWGLYVIDGHGVAVVGFNDKPVGCGRAVIDEDSVARVHIEIEEGETHAVGVELAGATESDVEILAG